MHRTAFSFFILLLVVSGSVRCEDEPKAEEKKAEDTKGAAEVTEEKDVLVLTQANFDQVIKDNKLILVEFYAPWCGHCKSLEPEYATAATVLKANDPPVALGKVDATAHEELGSRFGVQGYPTLFLFKDGEKIEYDGPRQKDGIVSYMKERADPNWKPPPPAVLHLTSADFDETIKNNDYILVEFYAPWCGHCKQLAPQYEKAAKMLKMQDPPIHLAAVDAEKEKDLGTKYEVSGYPTLKLFRKGKPFEYNGPRDEHGIVRWMIENRVDAAKVVKTMKEVDEKKQDQSVLIAGFFNGGEETPLLKAFTEATNNLREDFTSVQVREPDVTAKVGGPQIVLYMPKLLDSKYESKEKVFEKADATDKEVEEWIKNSQLPLVGHYADTASKFYDAKRPFCMIFYSVDFGFDHRKATQMWRHKLADIAKDYPGITFAVASDERESEKLKELQLEDSSEDMNVGCWDKDGRRFPMPEMEEFEADHIRDFLDKFVANKLTPIVKSQPVPKRQNNAVKTVVGKNFDEIVNDKTKDVLIEFYAPWCGHCKDFEPKYEAMAKELAKTQPNLVLAKMDSTANDAPSNFKVEGFPTIYFAAANSKDAPAKYEGNREGEDLKIFLQQHASVSFQDEKAKDAGKAKEEL